MNEDTKPTTGTPATPPVVK